MNKPLLGFLILWSATTGQHAEIPKQSFWDTQRRGANGGIEDAVDGWFEAAAGFGIEYIRLSASTGKSSSQDFLIGDIDDYKSIPSQDLRKLIEVLDRAEAANVKIVLTLFGLPGARWRQQNDMQFDYRLWEDKKYHYQSAQFWKELATALKNHPAVVGYNILNEPHPERKDGFQSGQTQGFESWLKKSQGTAADLDKFYQTVIEAIRKVDKETPIVLDSRFHASPEGFDYFAPIKGEGIYYSFHFYSPYTFTTFRINKGRYFYPDNLPTGRGDETTAMSKDDLASMMEPVQNWAKRYEIPNQKIIAAEIGCDRRVEGARQYLADVIDLVNEYDWHWGFYSFRSSSWDGMDYELGTEKLNWKYWQGIEQGKSHEKLINREDNPLWNTILAGLQEKEARSEKSE